MDFRKVSQAIKQAADVVEQNEKFPVYGLAIRASKAAQQTPNDAPLVTVSNVLNKMADSKTFISRKELKDLCGKMYSNNSSIFDVFAKELGENELPQPKYAQRSKFEDTPMNVDYDRVSDPVLSNALSEIWGEKGTYKPYSKEIAKFAEKTCMAELNSLDVAPKKIDVFAGNQDIIFCDAVYDTPKGESHVLVPVEIKENKALFPTMFLSKVGFVDLEKKAVEEHIKATAGKNFRVNGEKLLKVWSDAKYGVKKEDSDASVVKMAAIKMASEKNTPAQLDANGVIYQEIDSNKNAEVELPDLPKDPEVESFAKRMSTPFGVAAFLFGEDLVKKGASVIDRALRSFGYNSQISVADSSENEIQYAVSLNNVAGVKIPVKISNGKVFPPKIAVASGSVAEFSKTGLSKLLSEAETDSKMISAASTSSGLKPSELLEKVESALMEGNFAKAEEVITVIGEVDTDVQKEAIERFIKASNGELELKKEASTERKCSNIVKSANSQYPLCGHLNIPLHKVYQDEAGDCYPLYRKNMKRDKEGGNFMNHKIFL